MSCSTSCQRITYLRSINTEIGIAEKTCIIVTDNRSNLVKAFKHFSLQGDNGVQATETAATTSDNDDVSSTSEVNNGDDDEDSYMKYHVLDELLSPPDSDDDKQEHYQLPPHFCCACHTLYLVAITDASKANSVALKKVSTQTFVKLQATWNKQNSASLAADNIKDSSGTYLITPGATRWNSTYDTVCHVHSLLYKPDLKGKFDKLLDDLKIRRLQPIYMAEYLQVMQPICCGLDVLQGENAIELEYLLPALTVIFEKLD